MITTNKQLYSKLFICQCLQAFFSTVVPSTFPPGPGILFFSSCLVSFSLIFFIIWLYQAIYSEFEGFLNVILSSRSYAPRIVYIKELQLPVSILREVNLVSKIIELLL
jgi:hypothetical protein